jgi:hypothetical protein
VPLFEQPSGRHRRDPVGHRQRFLLIVGNEYEGVAERFLRLTQFQLHLLARLLVERAERLVQQPDLRPLDQHPGERDPLALAAGHSASPVAICMTRTALPITSAGRWAIR